MPMASTIPLVLLIFCLYSIFDQAQNLEFSFHGFNGSETSLTQDRVSIIKPSGALRLTNRSQYAIGHAFYSKPLEMFNKSTSSSPNASSFSTTFVFAIVPPSDGQGGYGLAFVLAPSKQFLGAAPEHYLGLLNSSNDGHPSNHIFAVEFDTVNGFTENLHSEGNHVGININSMISRASKPASYNIDTNRSEDLKLESGNPIQAWIEYDGVDKVVDLTIGPMSREKPTVPLISFGVDLTPIVNETMYVGFSASTGKIASSHYILGWSFSMNGVARPLNSSLLPLPPKEKNPSSNFKPSVIALITSLCAVTVLLCAVLVSLTVHRRMGESETLEDWELECPHRFRYHDLYVGTKGFKESEIIGVGGFGAVYKAVLPDTGNEVAVKKITRNSIHGLREFTAEIESLGQLRHKHLVNLQGWCKKKNDLLLVYDYIPNGSLYSLLYPENNFVLSWKQRFNILKGIAAGLLYLHEEWEQVVIHRDVKSSNVLIDSEMNGRLGDFGLARLYDHGTMSHTTHVVGTIGYIAPELVRTGKASTSSDVFAYGVLLLEVASGRRPIDSNQFILVDWVIECQQIGRILAAVDPKLNSRYAVEEVELVLGLGLLCSRQKQEARPNMRQVVRYLNGDDQLPGIDDLGSIDSQSMRETNSRLLEAISSDTITASYRSSSIGGMSTSSLGGR